MTYVRCPVCGHLYVREQPSADALRRRFAGGDELAGVYTDAASLEVRMTEVVRPKLAWTLAAASRHGRGHATLADLGAGGGHFVAAAREAGVEAAGWELSAASCRFAREVLGVELRRGDVTGADPTAPADVVTLWGVLEYVPEPRAFVRHALRFLAPGGLMVVEVPRADALSTALARAFPGTVSRHLEPTSHLNLFSDASLATLLWDAGLAPVAAWRFGMDAHELVSQIALRVTPEAAGTLAGPLLGLQDALDRAGLCDDIVVAAVRR
jgi:SAM-dependent methyltransferase